MSADAVAVFRPKDFRALEPFLDLDEESDESDGLYAERLDDGAVLVFTFQPFELFADGTGEAAREWLDQFGDALSLVHDDPRGLLLFPDTIEPDGRTYDSVVVEAEPEGVWIATEPDAEEASGFVAGGLPPIDMEALQAFAGELLGGAEGQRGAVTSYDVAKLFEGMQQQLVESLGMQLPGGAAEASEAEDEREPPADTPVSDDSDPGGRR